MLITVVETENLEMFLSYSSFERNEFEFGFPEIKAISHLLKRETVIWLPSCFLC